MVSGLVGADDCAVEQVERKTRIETHRRIRVFKVKPLGRRLETDRTTRTTSLHPPGRLRLLPAPRADSRPAYNICVADAHRQNDSVHKQRHSIYATETSGLLLIALLLLVLTLVRYWHVIHWSVR